MSACVTTFRVRPAAMDEFYNRAYEVLETMREIDGLETAHTVWGEDGVGMTTALFAEEEDADEVTGQIEALWEPIRALLVEAPKTVFYENLAIFL